MVTPKRPTRINSGSLYALQLDPSLQRIRRAPAAERCVCASTGLESSRPVVSTPAVAAAIAAAEALFNAQGVNDTTLTATERRSALSLAGQLDKYNNGLVGPGHCDEDPYSY